MIVGNGLIATAFRPYFEDTSDYLLFASGVSNSRETSESAFAREREMLSDAIRHGKFIVYFGTCSVHDPELRESPYVVHKTAMESLVKSSDAFAIFRLPQVVGNTSNPNTLTNYLYRQVVSGNRFQLWKNAKRNLIDVDDVASIVSCLVREDQANGFITNIACPHSVYVQELVSALESIVGKKANYELVNAGGTYLIEATVAAEVASRVGVDFDNNYIERVLEKYYGK